MEYSEKKQALKDYLQQLAKQDLVVAFSGGVDSSLLLRMCCEAAQEAGTTVYAITVQTELHPQGEVEIAQRVAQEAGAKHLVIRLDEFNEADIRMNPVDRCYRCKRCLFAKLQVKAQQLGASQVVEGTNEDDMHVYRPGIKALKELGICSPLAKFGLTKAEVRKLADEYGISVANRASTPCMATRFPYGTELSKELMRQVSEVEEWMRQIGFYNVRLRVHGNIARLEIDQQEMTALIDKKDEIVERIKQMGIDYVTLDLEGFRSGSMDIKIERDYHAHG